MESIRSRFGERFFNLTLANLFIFATLWLFTGFATGTSVLMGPVRWVTDVTRAWGWSSDLESILVRVIIVAYVAATFVICLFLARTFIRTPLRHVRVLIGALPVLCAAGALWLFLSPQLMGVHRGSEESVSQRFTFGPYPTAEKMQELKERGFTGVISLLHPAVVPFEPKLLADEQENAAAVGIELIHTPMLPWIGENETSLQRLRELARSEEGRYYVHCYLGKDRVRVVAKLIQSVDPNATSGDAGVEGRRLTSRRALERGPLIRLDEGVLLSPYPTDEEFLSYIVGHMANVVSLLDPAEPLERDWIAEERRLLERYEIPHLLRPVRLNPVDPEEIRAIAEEVRDLDPPVLVHPFLIPSSTSDAFIAAYIGAPPLNRSRLTDPMSNGRPFFIDQSILYGPRPEPTEIGILLRSGIRHLGFVGNVADAGGDQDTWDVAIEQGLDFQIFSPENFDPFSATDPQEAWYFYGPELPRRHLSTTRFFENQPVVRIKPDIFVTTAPRFGPISPETRELVLDAPWRTVALVFDPSLPAEQRVATAAAAELERAGKTLRRLPFPKQPFDSQRAFQLASTIYAADHPLLVLGMSPDDVRIQALITALRAGVPPAVPALLERRLRQGQVQVVAPNVAIGPRPTAPEFLDPLRAGGIRSFIYLGDSDSIEAQVDAAVAKQAGLAWQVMDTDSELVLSKIRFGGPYYVYGSERRLVDVSRPRLGPPQPEVALDYVFSGEAAEIRAQEISLADRIRSFLEAAIPSLRLIILATPIILIYTYLAAAYSARLKKRGVRTPYTRKVFHIIIFTGACALQLAFGLSAVVLFGSLVAAAVLYAVWRGDDFGFYEALARPTDAPRRSLFIIIPLVTTALGGVLANLFFGKFAVAGYLVGGWGDAVGEPVGSRFGKHKYSVPSLAGVPATRSIEGSAAVALVGFAAAVIALFGLGYDWPVIMKTAALCALGSALVEAVSNHGLDNLTIQVAAAGICFVLLA